MMKPMTFEYMIENNPLRARIREKMEVKCLRAAAEVGSIDHALHIACGNGSATRLILKHFPAKRLSAVDRDCELIAAARRTHMQDARSHTIDFSVQDVRSLSFDDGLFDAAFDLADLHNIPDWRRGLTELNRVLKPGGLLFLEELSLETFSHAAGRLFKALTDHPYDSMLTVRDFREQVLGSGFEILHFEVKIPFGLLKYFIMVARKVSAGPKGE
jgi:ubiquinone/menaquinone biosynthesis C-methylase UbiE